MTVIAKNLFALVGLPGLYCLCPAIQNHGQCLRTMAINSNSAKLTYDLCSLVSGLAACFLLVESRVKPTGNNPDKKIGQKLSGKPFSLIT